MAKKGLSYSPNEALIKGAAAIGMSKLPADQTALGKIAELGTGILKQESERRQKAEDAIDNTIAQVLADDGTLSDQHFSLATKQAQEYKEIYMQGVRMNNDEGNILKTKALNNLQKLSNSSNEEVELRKNLAKLKEDNLLTDNLDIATFEAYLNNDYVLRYEDGKKIYKIDNVDYTYEDIKKFEKDIKNPALTDANFKQINNLPAYIKYNAETKTKTFNDRAFNEIMLNSISTDERGFLNQIKDTTIGGQSIENVILNASGDILKGLENEFLVGIELVDMNKDDELDATDQKLMIKEAILNPENAAFNLDNSRKIIADLLTADARNKANKDGLLYVEPKTNNNNNRERDTYYMPAVGGYVPKTSVDGDVAILNEDPKDIPVRTSYNNVQFRKVNGQYQVYVENKFVNVTKDQLIATLQFDEKVGIERSAVTTTTETKAPEKYFNPKTGKIEDKLSGVDLLTRPDND